MKNRNNKGFSLVELIVVVAIMAVLVGVLAPAYLKYVEQSREKKDLNNIEEVRHAVEIALADEAVFAEVADGDTVVIDAETGAISITSATGTGDDNADFTNAIATSITNKVDLVSKKYGKDQTITININSTTGAVTVTCVINS